MAKLSDLPNIGAQLEGLLTEVGIDSFESLKQTGSQKAWMRMLSVDPSGSYIRLLSLEGAIRGVHWKKLPESVKAELKAFYDVAKRG